MNHVADDFASIRQRQQEISGTASIAGSDDPVVALYGQWLEKHEAVRRIEAEGQGEFGSEFEEQQQGRLEEACEHRSEIAETIMRTAASTVAGVLCKLAVAESIILELGPEGCMLEEEHQMTVSAKSDLERMAGARINAPRAFDIAERALIGVILSDNGALRRIEEPLQEDDFVRPIHWRIYRAAAQLIEAGHQVNRDTMRLLFDQDPDLAKLGGAQYFDQLAARASKVDDVDELLCRVRGRASAAS